MIERVDNMSLPDSYGNKWALNLIKKFLHDNIDDNSTYKAIGPDSKEMKEFWWALNHSEKRYDHEMKERLETMIKMNNVSVHINEEVDEDIPFPYNYMLWNNAAPLAWFNFKVGKYQNITNESAKEILVYIRICHSLSLFASTNCI